MIVLLNYRMNGAEAEFENLKTFFEGIGKTVELTKGTLFAYGEEEAYTSEEPVMTVYLKKALEDSRKLKTLLPGGFIMEGTIDTSSIAGEYMDFMITVDANGVSVHHSDWYCETSMDAYEDYEDFCDGFCDCPEDEYERLKESEFVFLLETDHGEVLSDSVPLNNTYEIE